MERGPRPMATMPDCTSSLMPNGSRTRSSASSLSLLPVASMVTASGATSTTLARNSWAVSSTWDRLDRSALTLTSRISRCTEAARSSSTTLSTSMSLFSCLVTCSSGRSSTSTTTVIREISGCSVGPTARESMLNPRRENRPAMRASTPGLFSTSTDRVCLLIPLRSLCSPDARAPVLAPLRSSRASLLALPHRGHAPSRLDLVVAHAGRDHRPHHRVAVHHEVHDHGHVVDLHRLGDRGVDLVGRLAAQAHAAVGVGELDEVGHPPLDTGVQVGVGVALVVEERLPLPDHAQAGVVDHRDLDRDVVDDAGGQLLVGHLEAAVAVDRPHGAVRLGDLGAHGRRDREAHGAEAPGVDPAVGPLVADELGRPHLVLADSVDEHRLRAADRPDPLDDVLRGDRVA